MFAIWAAIGLASAASAGAAAGLPTDRPCYGAPSMDRALACHDPSLRGVVFPAPLDAIIETSPRCANVVHTPDWWECAAGAPAERVTGTVALLGDSHAGHWRPALDHFATARGLRLVSITRSGCPFSTGTPILPEGDVRPCIRWRRGVIRWFNEHPEISTVFVSGHAGAKIVTPKGQQPFAAKKRAVARAWSKLPTTVRHIIVLRDVPKNSLKTMSCVEAALERRKITNATCAVPRSFATQPDPAASAAHALHRARVQVIDLTRYFCGRRFCFPIIGGALVHKDADHLTAEFATSLAPYVDRAFAALRPAVTVEPGLIGKVSFAGAARSSAGGATLRYRATVAIPRAWRLVYRTPNGAAEHLAFAGPEPCSHRVLVKIAMDATTEAPPEGVTPLAGRTTQAGGANADWAAWAVPAASRIAGTWIRHTRTGRDLTASLTAEPAAPCSDADAAAETGRAASLLHELRVRDER